jgi:putative transposase
MKFIAIKTDDGTIKGKLAFYCRMLHVSRQGFYKYLSVKDRPWKYQTLADTMLEIHAEDVCNDTYGRVRMFQALTLKRPDGIPIPSERTVYRVIVLSVIRKELRKQTVRLVNRMIFLREISHQKSLLKNA